MKNIQIILLISSIFLMQCKQNSENTTAKAVETPVKKTETRKNIIFFGNSLTAAYGLEVLSKGFVGLIQQRIDSLGLPYRRSGAVEQPPRSAAAAQDDGAAHERKRLDIELREQAQAAPGGDVLRISQDAPADRAPAREGVARDRRPDLSLGRRAAYLCVRERDVQGDGRHDV